MASSWLFRPLPLRERVGRGVAPVGSTLRTRRLVVPSPPHPNPLPQGERKPEVASAKRVIANSTVLPQGPPFLFPPRGRGFAGRNSVTARFPSFTGGRWPTINASGFRTWILSTTATPEDSRFPIAVAIARSVRLCRGSLSNRTTRIPGWWPTTATTRSCRSAKSSWSRVKTGRS